MYSHTFLDSNSTHRIDKNFVQVNTFDQHVMAQATLKTDPSTRINPAYESDMVHISFLVIPLIGWSVLITSLLIAFLRRKKEVVQTSIPEQTRQNRSVLDSKRSIPCTRCRFFSSNSYVHCAVHPSKVLTEQAVNCPDYYSS